MKEFCGVGLGSGFVQGRLDLTGERRRRACNSSDVVIGFQTAPSIVELFARLNAPDVRGAVLPVCSPYSHLAWAISYSGVPVVIVQDRASRQVGEIVYLDADRGLVLYPESEEEIRRLEEERAMRDAEVRWTESRALLPAVSKAGVAIRVLAQIQSAEDVSVARDCGAEGVGEIKLELLRNDMGGSGSAASIIEAIRTETAWTDIPIRFFDFDGEKAIRGYHPGPMGARGIRLLENDEGLMAQFLGMLDGVDPEGIIVVLPMVTLPAEVERFCERIGDRRLRIGILVETPAAAVNIDKFLDLCDYVEIGVNDLTQFTMAWDRVVPHSELLPVKSLVEPVERLVLGVAKAVRERQGFASLAIDLPPSTQLVRQVVHMGLQAITVPPRLIPLWKERIRLAE